MVPSISVLLYLSASILKGCRHTDVPWGGCHGGANVYRSWMRRRRTSATDRRYRIVGPRAGRRQD